MRIRTHYQGRSQPFERDRRLVLRRLPVGAVVSRVQLVLQPYSLDPGGHFLEPVAFAGSIGDWGASKRVLTGAVEIDLRARRRLASMVSSNLANAHLLVDIGGGFMLVNSDGGFGGTNALQLSGTSPELPGLTVTGLRVPQTADISRLNIASPPSDVTVAVDGGPVFFTHFGDLVDPVSTPDFSALLQGLLARQPVDNGQYVLSFVVHSGSIARLDLELDLEYTVAVSAMPAGVASVKATYAYDGVPTGNHGRLIVPVPPGTTAVAGASTGRAQGVFEASQVVFGDLRGVGAPENVVLGPAGPLAQPFVLPTAQVATSVDLLLTAVTAGVTVALDLVEDLDGKPGRRSMLPRVAELTLTRDQAGSPTWLNVPLPGELEISAGARQWLVLQSRAGTAIWGAAADGGAPGPGLQRTSDGALSWRAVAGDAAPAPLKAQLRLRRATSTFHLPLELRAEAGDTETSVSLQRLAPQGSVDLGLDIPEVAAAVNTALTASGLAGPAAEAVVNGDFLDWYGVGATVRDRGTVYAAGSGLDTDPGLAEGWVIGFGPDSAVGYAASHVEDTMHFLAFDVFSADLLFDAPLDGAGTPVALAVDATGRHAVVSASTQVLSGAASVPDARLVAIDTATGRSVGVPVPAPMVAQELAIAPDGTGLYLLGPDGSAPATTSVRFAPWGAVLAAAGGADLDWTRQPSASVDGDPLALAVGADGRVYTLSRPAVPATGGPRPDPTLRVFTGLDDQRPLPTVPGAVDLAVTADGRSLLVLTPSELWFVDPDGISAPRTLAFTGGPVDGVVAVVPRGDLALVMRRDSVSVVDLTRRAFIDNAAATIEDTSKGAALAINPAGTHALVARQSAAEVSLLSIGDALPVDWQLTAGLIEPDSLPGTGDVVAVLGRANFSVRASRFDPVTSSISQVVPATGGASYRFAFDALSRFDGAVGQVIWRANNCVTSRTDRVPIQVIDPNRAASADRLAHHALDLVAPAGATQAELRFYVPDGLAAVDKVSLAGSSDVVGQSWTAADASATITQSGGGLAVTNRGAASAAVSQVVRASAGERFDLAVTARVPADQQGTAIELTFSDEQLGSLTPVTRLVLDPLEFDDRAASGVVPMGAVAGEVRLIVPPGGSVEVAALTMSVRPSADVDLHFVADAPGELALIGVSVMVDQADPVPVRMPADGLCRPTPSGSGGPDGTDCYCGACGQNQPVRQEVAGHTDAGRPASVSPCPNCGSPRVRLGGRLTAHAAPLQLPGFRLDNRPAAASGAPIATRRVDLPLHAIRGIGPTRAGQLRELGIGDIVALSQADTAKVASLPGLTAGGAAQLINAAARVVRERGPRRLFDDS